MFSKVVCFSGFDILEIWLASFQSQLMLKMLISKIEACEKERYVLTITAAKNFLASRFPILLDLLTK